MVVNKGDGLMGVLDAVHGEVHLTVSGGRLQDFDVVDRLPVTVVHRMLQSPQVLMEQDGDGIGFLAGGSLSFFQYLADSLSGVAQFERFHQNCSNTSFFDLLVIFCFSPASA